MLYLLFDLGNDAYALETSAVLGVLPFDDVERAPQASAFAGTIGHGDERVPVIDLCFLALGRSAERRFGTRVILMNHIVRGATFVLGLLAERATRTTRRNPAEFAPAKRDVGALLARIDADRLLCAAPAF